MSHYSPMKIPVNSVFNYDQSLVSSVYIRKLVLRESGTYNNQFERSYETHLSPQSVNVLTNKAAENGMGVFRPSSLSGLASNMLSISAAPDSQNPISIENGWNGTRLLFFMDVLTTDISGAEIAYYIQGYTNYVGLSLQSKQLDPQMVFYINNIVVARMTGQYQTPQGMMQSQSLVQTDHVLYNPNAYQGDQQWTMRPEDVYKVLTSSSFGNQISNNTPAIYDQRTKLTNSPQMSRRINSIPSNYTSTLIQGFMDVTNTMNPHANPSEAYDAAVNQISESTPSLNPFLSALAKKRSSGTVSGIFQWKDLVLLDTNLANPSNNIVTIAVAGQTQGRQQHQAGQTENWNGASIETKYAATISQAIPALMLECMLYQVSFSSNNMMRLEGNYSGIYTVMTNASAMHQGPAINEVEAFKRRLEIEVLKDISYNNQQKFDIRVSSQVFGDTWLSISIDGGPYYDFVTPTFCDGIISPVLTHNYGKVETVAAGIDSLVTQVADAFNNGYERTMFSAPSGPMGGTNLL